MASMQREIRAQTICLLVMLGFLVAGAFYWLRPVLLPFVLAIFIVSGLMPILHSIERRFHAPRLVALAIASILGFFVIFLLWTVTAVSVSQLARNASQYEQRFQDLAAIASEWIPQSLVRELDEESPTNRPANEMTDEAGSEDIISEENSEEADQPLSDEQDREEDVSPPYADLLSPMPEPGGAKSPPDQSESDSRESRGLPDQVSQMLSQGVRILLVQLTQSLMEIMGSGTMVVIFMLFLLLGGSDAVPRSDTWIEIDQKIRQYIVSKSLISFFTGLIFGFVLWLFGIPLAMVFALLAFLFNFIPNIGPIIAAVLPVPLILFDPELSTWGMIMVISLASAVQIISGNVVEPKMLGDSVDMHPIVVLLALMFWGMIWGIVGMFLATPITAAMKILFSKFESTRPLAALLEGRVDGLDFDFLNVGGMDTNDRMETDDKP
ncbi:MAG: AI-2E family transporter [Pirellulaceae bacterium]